MTNVPFLIGPN